jgi:hypothetical protein
MSVQDTNVIVVDAAKLEMVREAQARLQRLESEFGKLRYNYLHEETRLRDEIMLARDHLVLLGQQLGDRYVKDLSGHWDLKPEAGGFVRAK